MQILRKDQGPSYNAWPSQAKAATGYMATIRVYPLQRSIFTRPAVAK